MIKAYINLSTETSFSSRMMLDLLKVSRFVFNWGVDVAIYAVLFSIIMYTYQFRIDFSSDEYIL